jgi:hypothetical protein
MMCLSLHQFVLRLMLLTLTVLVHHSASQWNILTAVTAFDVSLHSHPIVRSKNVQYRKQYTHTNKFRLPYCKMTNPNENGGTGYDLSKPIYDLYALRMVRGDAMIQYNLRNQSEPLRINLALLGTLFLLCLPSLISKLSGAASSAAVVPTVMPLVTPDLTVTIPQTAVSWLGAVGCFAFGVQQSQKRNKQLLRIEKECFAGDLCIQLPMTWIASDRPYQTQEQSIRNVIKSKSCRVLAMSGPSMKLEQIVKAELAVYNRRWKQSSTYWVLIPTDIVASDRKSTSFLSQIRYPWLAQAYDINLWIEFFQSLQSTDNIAVSKANVSISWFGLSATGRSFGSGTTKPASYLQILGNSLSPIDVFFDDDDTDQNSATDQRMKENIDNDPIEADLLSCQNRFYDALTKGKLNVMKSDVYDDALDDEVSSVIQQGGRLDEWDKCLMVDAKPTGMTISDREVIQIPTDDPNVQTAYTTCIEFPVDTYLGGVTPTLLAVQKWKKATVTDTTATTMTNASDVEWKLVQHQTIPWTNEGIAGGTLICDCRGCVALVRTSSSSTASGR